MTIWCGCMRGCGFCCVSAYLLVVGRLHFSYVLKPKCSIGNICKKDKYFEKIMLNTSTILFLSSPSFVFFLLKQKI